jgi:tetratricopeptide (TPR) repeat protein
MIKQYVALLFLFTTVSACALEHAAGTSPVVVPDAPVAPAFSSPEARTLSYFAQARLRAADGDPGGALALLRKAIEQDPKSPFLYTAAAQLFLQQNRPEEALSACQAAIRLDANFVQAQLLAGNILAAMQHEKEAIPYYQKVMALDPTKEEVYLHVAIFYLKSYDYEQAVNTLKALIKAVPESPLGYYYLAKTYDQMRLPREGLAYYKKALELKPDFEQAMIEMGISQETQGQIGDAIDTYKSLLEINPANTNVVQHLAQLYIQQRRLDEALTLLQQSGGESLETSRKIGLLFLELERYDEAVTTFEEILKAEPAAHQIRFYLATANEEMEEVDQAIEEFSKIPRESPYYLDALGHLGYLYKEKGTPEKGVALLKDEIKRDPTRVEPYLHLAGLYESMDRLQEGIEVLKSMDPKLQADPRVSFRLGILYDKTGNKELSVAMMKRVLAATPNDAQALNYLGYTFAEMGTNLEEALSYLKKAVSLKPDDGFILDSLGWTYYKLKRYGDAVAQLERAVKLSEDDATVIGHLADAYCANHAYKKALPLYKRLQKMEPERTDLTEKIKHCRQESGEK